MELLEILKQNKSVGIVGSSNSGKTTTLFNLLDSVSKLKTSKYMCCFHQETKEGLIKKHKDLRFFDTLNELEQIHNSFIFIDEFHNLFNTDDRHQTEIIKGVFNQIHHNNNIIVLCSTPEYYNKLICGFVDSFVLCKIKDFVELVNGSQLKRYILSLATNLKGATCFNLSIGKIFYKGLVISINYNKEQDKKQKSINLFEVKNDK